MVHSEKLRDAENLEKNGDSLYFLLEMTQAKTKYMEAKNIYLELGLSEKVYQIEEKIEKVEENENQKEIDERVNQAIKLTRNGDELLQVNNYDEANQKYLEAKGIYKQLSMIYNAFKIDEKIRNN